MNLRKDHYHAIQTPSSPTPHTARGGGGGGAARPRPPHHRHARREYTHPPRVVTQPKTPPLLNAQLSAAEKNWRGEVRRRREASCPPPTRAPPPNTLTNAYNF